MKDEKKIYKYVFVVLTYRNTEDIEEFLISLEKCCDNFKVIIVNSYFDDKTKCKFEKVAEKFHCDFLNVPNKGYGTGNNRGIELAQLKYEFEYLVISNPDIIVKKFDIKDLNKRAIYCGKIINLAGKLQNPIHAKESNLSDWLVYKGMQSGNRFYFLCGVAISKLYRSLFNWKVSITTKSKFEIFAAHGSFFAIGVEALEILEPVFDENIFLFSEEHILAIKAKRQNIPIYYLKSIECKHKEDGSMKLWGGNINNELKKSVIYCFENYLKCTKDYS